MTHHLPSSWLRLSAAGVGGEPVVCHDIWGSLSAALLPPTILSPPAIPATNRHPIYARPGGHKRSPRQCNDGAWGLPACRLNSIPLSITSSAPVDPVEKWGRLWSMRGNLGTGRAQGASAACPVDSASSRQGCPQELSTCGTPTFPQVHRCMPVATRRSEVVCEWGIMIVVKGKKTLKPAMAMGDYSAT